MTDVLLTAAVGAAVGAAIGVASVAVGFRAGLRYAAGLAAARDDAPSVVPIEAVVTMTMSAPVSMSPPGLAGFGSQCQWHAITSADADGEADDDDPSPDGLDPNIWRGMDGGPND